MPKTKLIFTIMIDIRENKRILEKIREYGSTCFKSNEYPYEYIIEDEKVVFYHKITGREIGSADLELTVLVYKKCGSKETEVSEVEKHLVKKKQV